MLFSYIQKIDTLHECKNHLLEWFLRPVVYLNTIASNNRTDSEK